jgi:hypothetical protein
MLGLAWCLFSSPYSVPVWSRLCFLLEPLPMAPGLVRDGVDNLADLFLKVCTSLSLHLMASLSHERATMLYDQDVKASLKVAQSR